MNRFQANSCKQLNPSSGPCLKLLQSRRILAWPLCRGAAFFAAKPVQENLRLSFTTADDSQIRAGIAVLAQVIQDHLPR
jgi:DNA-binding transcriptional MocR family regulator